MSGKRYTVEFKVTAVKQIVESGHPAAEVACPLVSLKLAIADIK